MNFLFKCVRCGAEYNQTDTREWYVGPEHFCETAQAYMDRYIDERNPIVVYCPDCNGYKRALHDHAVACVRMMKKDK